MHPRRARGLVPCGRKPRREGWRCEGWRRAQETVEQPARQHALACPRTPQPRGESRPADCLIKLAGRAARLRREHAGRSKRERREAPPRRAAAMRRARASAGDEGAWHGRARRGAGGRRGGGVRGARAGQARDACAGGPAAAACDDPRSRRRRAAAAARTSLRSGLEAQGVAYPRPHLYFHMFYNIVVYL